MNREDIKNEMYNMFVKDINLGCNPLQKRDYNLKELIKQVFEPIEDDRFIYTFFLKCTGEELWNKTLYVYQYTWDRGKITKNIVVHNFNYLLGIVNAYYGKLEENTKSPLPTAQNVDKEENKQEIIFKEYYSKEGNAHVFYKGDEVFVIESNSGQGNEIDDLFSYLNEHLGEYNEIVVRYALLADTIIYD